MSLEFLVINDKGYIRFKGRLCKQIAIRVLKRYIVRKCFDEHKLLCKTIKGNIAERLKPNGTKVVLQCIPQTCPYSNKCSEFTLIKAQAYNDIIWVELYGAQEIYEGANYKLFPMVRNNKAYPKLVIY